MSLTTQRPAPPTVSTPASRGSTRGRPTRKRDRKGYKLFVLFTFPNLLLIAVFAYWPVIGNIYLSLTEWDMIAPTPLFVGIDNYTKLFGDPAFLRVLRLTLVWVVAIVGISLTAGLALACLFNRQSRGRAAVSALAFSPHILSGAAVAAIWLFIFDPNYGLSRALFGLFGQIHRTGRRRVRGRCPR